MSSPIHDSGKPFGVATRNDEASEHSDVISRVQSNDSASSSPASTPGSARLSDYFDKMTEMQRRAFEKLYESALDGPCQALVTCEQNLEQNFKEGVCSKIELDDQAHCFYLS